MKKKRLLAWLMTLVMMFGLMPATAFAAEDAYVSASKTAKRVDEDTWEITMQVTAKGKDVKPEPLELVILMDTSYSMQWDVEGNQWWVDDEDRRITIAGDAAKQLIADLAKDNINAKVAVYKFDAKAHKISGLTQLTSSNLGTIQEYIPDSNGDLSKQYGTNITAGLKAAAGSDGNPVFSGTTDNKVIVLLGDGDPYNDTDGEDGPNADTIKAVKEQGITVHTIGFAQHVAALERIAKGTGVGDKTGKYYTADDAKELAAAFKQIKDSLTAMIVDNMSSKAGSDVTFDEIVSGNVSETDNGFNWNPAGGVLEAGETATITYRVNADASKFKPGNKTINLNGTTVLSYETTEGNKGTVNIPAPTDTVEVVKVVEHYMLDGEEVDTKTHKNFFLYGDNGSVVVDADAYSASKIPADATYMGSVLGGNPITVDTDGQATITATVGGTYDVYHNYVSVAAPTVEKDADKTNAKEGDTINYTVTVTNKDVLERTFEVTDDFFAKAEDGVITVKIGDGVAAPATLTEDGKIEVTLEPEQVATITYAYKVTRADAGETLVNNATATVTGKDISGKDKIEIPVEANVGELDSSKFVVTGDPGTLTSGNKVPAGIAYPKDGVVALPEKETVKVLFGITVENRTTKGLGKTKTFDVVDIATPNNELGYGSVEYIGYAGTAEVEDSEDGISKTVTLDAGKTVTLYFVQEFSKAQTYTNNASVNGDPVTATVQIGKKSTMLTILKDRIAKATADADVPTLPEGVVVPNGVTPNYEPTPVIDFTDGEVTLLYKVTVENTDDNRKTSNIMFFNTTEPEGLQYVVTDAATYVGYDSETAFANDAKPRASEKDDETEVTGYLKYGEKVDLYFVRTFTADEILEAKGNAVNTAVLDGADKGEGTETTPVKVNKSSLISDKFLVDDKPELNDGVKVPSDVVYEAKLPEGEKIKLLFGVEVENHVDNNAGEQKTFVVEDDGTEYIGYATTATEGVTVTKKTDDSASVTLDAGKTVTLYFVMEVDASKVDANGEVTNSASVAGEEKEIKIPVVDKGNKLSIEKVRVDENTANVPDAFKELADVNYTPATANNPLAVADGGSVKLLYKVTVENSVPVKEQLLALFAAEAPVYNGKEYVVYDEGATYVGCYKYGNAEVAEPAVDTTAAEETVKGTLKETEKIDLYFTKTFTDVSDNVTNAVTLTGANTGGDSETTPVKLTVKVDFDLGYAGAVKGETYKDQVIEKGTTATKPADPTRTGYDFKGWYTADGKEFDFTVAVNADTTVYAQWVPEGQLTKDSITKTRVTLEDAGTLPTLTGVDATKITYGDVVFDKDTDTVTLLYKVTVTNKNAVETKARTLNPGAITYKVVDEGAKYVAFADAAQPNADYGASEVTGTLEANETVTLYFAKEFTREQVEALENNKYQVTNTADLYDGNTKVDSATEPTPVTLKVTVTFDTHGGTTVPSQEIKIGTTATKPATDPTKEGYDFVGWYTAEGTAFVFADKIYEDTTVHAQWIEKGQLTEDSITKTRVGLTEAQDMPMLNGVNATDITYGDVVFNTKGDKVTLLYAVTVTNNNGAALPKMRTLNPGAVEYKVVDANAKYVAFADAAQPDAEYGANTVTGTLEAYETVTLYFAKEFTYKDAVKLSDGTYQVENTAALYWGDTPVGYDTEPTPVTLKEAVSVTKTSNVTNAKRNTWVEYTIVVENKGLTTLKDILVTETPDSTVFSEGEFTNLPASVEFVKDSDGKVDNDKVEIDELGVDGKVTLTYKAKVKSNAQKNATLKNTVVAEVPGVPTAKDELEQGKVYVPSSGGGGGKKPKPEIVAGDVEEILNTEDHFQYVQGYPDGTVGPERNITRAEATVIFFRLLQDHVRAELLTAENEFPDVKLDDWFNLGVSTMEAGGFVSGYEDGYFRPNGYITRAELATIISNFDDLEPATENKFADVEGHWAEKYVNSAAAKGWISGYDDGLFRPNQYITRAETMSMINRVLNRRVDEDGLHADAKQWRDNVKGQWYYYAVLEATNHHDYQRADVKDMENWTAINPNKVWEN